MCSKTTLLLRIPPFWNLIKKRKVWLLCSLVVFWESKYLIVILRLFSKSRCAAKSEENYRQLFEQFLQDVLAALYRPAWPVAELMLTVLGNLLVKKFRSKTEVSLRIACLDYLGTISARLRRDRVQARKDDKQHLDLVIKTLLSDEQSESIEDIDISNVSLKIQHIILVSILRCHWPKKSKRFNKL